MKKMILSVFFSAFLVLGTLGIAAPHSAEAAGLGYINTQKVFGTHPDMATIQSTLAAEQSKAQQDFDKNAKDLPEKEKAAYADKLSKRISDKQQELMKPLQKKILDAIAKVAKEKGVDSIVDASVMVYGGQDLTDDVIKAAK